MTTALTLYLNTAAATTVATANQLSDTLGSGGSTSTKNSLLGTATGYGEVYSQGNTGAWAGAGSIGASASGHGFLYDSLNLEGQQFIAGNWTPTVRLSCTSPDSYVADVYCRVFRRSSGGVYTQLVSFVATNKTISSGSTITFTAASLGTINFNTGDKLYLDVWLNVTSGALAGDNAKLLESTPVGTGAVSAQLVTPGYISLYTALVAYLSNAGSSIESTANTLYTVAGTPTTTTRDVVVGTATGFGEVTSHGPNGNIGNDSPYGVVYYFSGNTPSTLPARIIDLLVGGNTSGLGMETGLVPGGPIWLRPQLLWKQFEQTNGHTSTPTYNSTTISVCDDLISRCNAANILVDFCIQSAPQWRRTIDLNGNAVAYDGQTYIGTLTQAVTAGNQYTTLSLSALGVSETITSGQWVAIDYNGNTEYVVAQANYSHGATSIAVKSTAGKTFKAAFSHSSGCAVENAGGYFASPADTNYYVSFLLNRYNGTVNSPTTGQPMVINAIQWNEDYDTPGNNLQRDVQSKWFVTNWQTVGPTVRSLHPTCKIIGPAARRTGMSSVDSVYGLAHITTWTDHIFSYTPPGSSIQGAAQWLDALDFHYYRDNVGDPDPDDPLPGPSDGSFVPTPAQELAAIKAVAATYGYSAMDVWCTETGWDVFDDGTGTIHTVTEQQQADFICGPANSGNLTGKPGAFEQHRLNGGSHVFIWTLNPLTNAKMYLSPPTAVTTKDIVQNEIASAGATPVFTKLKAYTAMAAYIASYPQWQAGTWAASGSIGTATGRGWLLESTALENQQLQAGTYTATVTMRAVVNGAGSGTLVGDVHVRFSLLSGGVYTTIADTLLTSQTMNSSSTAYTTTASGALTAFSPGDKLYVDVWVKLTTNANANVNQAIRLQKLSTDITTHTGDVGAALVTPGYLATGGLTSLATIIEAVLQTESVVVTMLSAASSSQMTQEALAEQYARLLSSVVGGQLQIAARTYYGNATTSQVMYGELDALFPFESIAQLHVMKSVNDVTAFVLGYEYMSAVLADNPLVYYRLGETSGTSASDISGRAMTGVLSATGITLGQAGALAQSGDSAMLFDGTNGQIALPSAVRTANRGALSVEVWIKLTNTTFGYTAYVVANDAPSSTKHGFMLGVNNNSAVWRIGFGSIFTQVTASYSFVAGTWYHLVGTYDGATLTIYLNGAQVGSGSTAGVSISQTTNAVLIGGKPGASGNNLPAAVDEVAVYLSALSASRVAAHYQAGTAPS